MGTLIDGKKIAQTIFEKTEQRIQNLKQRGITPKLGVILIGNDKSSETYVRKKQEAAERIGIQFDLHRFPTTIELPEIVNEINSIQKDKKLTGLIVQLPVPEPLYTSELFNAVEPEIDVDCLTDINLGRLVMNTQTIQPPTAGAVMKILEELNIDLIGKNICLIGMGILVGKPLANLLINARASVTTCNSKTIDIKNKCLAADIIISGVGRPNIVGEGMVKKGTIVIDTGISFIDNKLTGDVNVEEVLAEAAYVTPTPGGVGPITVAMLLYNTTVCAEKKLSS